MDWIPTCVCVPIFDPKFSCNHVGGILIKRQNGPTCEKTPHKTVLLASVIRLTRAHDPFKSERFKCKMPACTFPA